MSCKHKLQQEQPHLWQPESQNPRTIEQYWQQWQQQPANPSSNISANNSKNMHILVYLLEGKTYIEVVRFN